MPVTVSAAGRAYALLVNSFTNAASGTVISPSDANTAHSDLATAVNVALGFAPIDGQRRVMGIQANTATPPMSPTEGQVWLVAPGGTGVFSGKDKKYAAYMAASWTFFDPSPGDTAIVVSTRQSFIYDFTGVWQMGNALAGANSNISSLSGLTTPLSVSQGGTAGNTAATARAGIGAAAAGVNSDITSLSGLTTPLSIAQGGTGVTSGIFPPGAMIDYAGSAAPAGWLLATGQAVSRTTYAALFAVISTTYGAGDGSTTFNVPDARGRVLAGLDNMGGIDAARMASIGTRLTLGGVGGADTHTLTTAQLASHAHTGTTTTDPGHIHSIGTVGLNVAGGTAQVAVPPQNASTINTNSGGAHAHTFTSDASGSGAAHNNVPPTLFINKIIKT